jgi:hypothetical protein
MSENVSLSQASNSKLTPLGQSDGAIDFEILAVVEVALLIEVVVN